MKSSIEEKMKKFLTNKDSVSESDIVYILVQLSKYYEREKVEDITTNTPIPCIKFFRNWIVHGIINKESKYTNTVVENYRKLNGSRFYQKLSNDLLSEIQTTNLITISKELKNSFKKNLFEVIKDIPIIVTGSKAKLIAEDYDKINLQEL